MEIFFVITFIQIRNDNALAGTRVYEFIVLEVNAHVRNTFSVNDKKELSDIREIKGLSEDDQKKVLEHYREIARRSNL